MQKPVKRNNLNAKQIHLLTLIYKFRFVSSALIAEYSGLVSERVVNIAFSILRDQNFIDRRYTAEYRLAHKPAEYYLATKGIKLLAQPHYKLNTKVLLRMRRNPSLSDPFIKHYLTVFRVYLQFQRKLGFEDTDYQIYTATELAGLGRLPHLSPDLYIRSTNNTKQSSDYFISVFENLEYYHIKKYLKSYYQHYQEGEWQENEARDYPTVLIACSSELTKQNLLKSSSYLLEDAQVDGLTILITSLPALLACDPTNLAIWTDSSLDSPIALNKYPKPAQS
jgi:predicted transcriptional regulator